MPQPISPDDTAVLVSMTEVLGAYIRKRFQGNRIVVAKYNYNDVGATSWQPWSPGTVSSIYMWPFKTYEDWTAQREAIQDAVKPGQDLLIYDGPEGFTCHSFWRYPLEKAVK
jgi:hypothetical protein